MNSSIKSALFPAQLLHVELRRSPRDDACLRDLYDSRLLRMTALIFSVSSYPCPGYVEQDEDGHQRYGEGEYVWCRDGSGLAVYEVEYEERDYSD